MTARPCDHSAIGAALAPPTPPAPVSIPNPRPLTPNPFRSRRRSARSRRGVLLLVVLSLLVLFTLIAVTFVLVASQSRRSVRADSRNEQYGDDPQKQLDSVFAQLVRDTVNPQSALRGHSLLADIYGNDGVRFSYGTTDPLNNPAPTVVVNPVSGNQFVDLQFDTSYTAPRSALVTGIDGTGTAIVATPTQSSPLTLNRIQSTNFFAGSLVTLTDGLGANLSARIVGSTYSGTIYTFRVQAFDRYTAANLNGTCHGLLVNGQPFNGTGFGFNPAADPTQVANSLLSNSTTISVPSVPTDISQTFAHAWLPNRVFFNKLPNGFSPTVVAGTPAATTTPIDFGYGGADEDYDAADPQNMILGYMPLGPVNVPVGTQSQIYPSLHRPETVNFVATRAVAFAPAGPTGEAARAHAMRQAMLRPLGQMRINGAVLGFQPDHPNFTGSNPNFDAYLGPWDIDNDGDGIPDSVWVDVGFPAQTAADGRRFKPLAAVLAIDLDGRFNVNAHGNIAQLNANYSAPIAAGTAPNLTIVNSLYATSPLTTATLFRGNGYGPADVNLTPLFGATADYVGLLKGRVLFGQTYEGRYGEYGATATVPAAYPFPMPGRTNSAGPDDVLDQIKRFGVPLNYYSTLSGYGTPSDLWGRAAFGVDYAGQPIYAFLQQTPTTVNGAPGYADPEWPNDPYALNLSRRRGRGMQSNPTTPTTNDNPFTPAELEAALRLYDVDTALLPTRLKTLVNPGGSNPNDYSRMITTDSNDLPSPGVLPTRDIANQLKTQLGAIPMSQRLVELLRFRLTQGGASNIELQIANMLPSEVIAGQRFDLNRPFGNGQDDDGNGVVDEPTQAEFNGLKEVPSSWTATLGANAPTGMDLNGDGSVNSNPSIATSDLYARQQYAKYLYVLMMLFVDQTYGWAQDPGLNATMQQELTARRVAQWAVNVVDYRDPDSIMTPFEYDVNPFNGWSVDGALIPDPMSGQDLDASNSERRVVWGCEQPDLLLTETLATHDRRVKDSPTDDAQNGPQNDRSDSANNMMPDTDYDQMRVPQGSLFLELYCPRPANLSQRVYSGDLYTNGQLDLGRMAPAGAGGQYPVWRVAISRSRVSGGANLPNDINARVLAHPDITNFDPVSQGSDPYGYSVFNPAAANPGPATIERIVWLGRTAPTGNPDAPIIYYNQSSVNPLLNPGAYALVGPRSLTNIGKKGGVAADQRIELSPAVEIYNAANQPYYASNNITPPLPIICASATFPPVAAGLWDAASAPEYIGLSVTEPLFSSPNYYKAPLPANTSLNYSTPLDLPLDKKAGTPLGDDLVAGLPTILNTGTTQNYKTAFLQRLANPLVPYDPLTNPYITVDWQPIDLVMFNGESLQTTGLNHQDIDDPGFQTPPASLNPGVGSRERGAIPAATADPNPWPLYPQQPQIGPVGAAGSGAVFDFNITQSLGFLNRAFGVPWNPGAAQAGYKGAPDPSVSGGRTFPWIAWGNRPFSSNMELLQVPATSAEQLVRQFSYPIAASNPYDATTATNFHTPYKHLLNFFLSKEGNPQGAPYFYRLLEYVHVPSRFVDTETYLNPTAVPPTPPYFQAPFNKVSNYREPGRVNINTIPGLASGSVTSPIWNGILNGIGGVAPGPTWTQVVASRRGDGGVGANVLSPVTNPAFTAFFGNPFRTAGGAAFTLPGMPVPTSEVQVTLMRPDVPTATSTVPLFQLPATAAQSFTNPDRNSYFRYQPLERLSNLLTTRSNVYAVWITVGYFEVTPWQPGIDTAHPDGYQLGAEIGSDSGEITRHRAFYIYDRSIPVGFEPGRDHNIDEGVLLKRFIE